MRLIRAVILSMVASSPVTAAGYNWLGDRGTFMSIPGHDFINAPNDARVVDVYRDTGGNVSHFKDKVQFFAAGKIPVRVHGTCSSACTLVLAYNNVCVDRQAVFKFHKARNAVSQIPNEGVTEEMIGWMPWAIQDRLTANISMNYNSQTIISGAELIRMGAAREC